MLHLNIQVIKMTRLFFFHLKVLCKIKNIKCVIHIIIDCNEDKSQYNYLTNLDITSSQYFKQKYNNIALFVVLHFVFTPFSFMYHTHNIFCEEEFLNMAGWD